MKKEKPLLTVSSRLGGFLVLLISCGLFLLPLLLPYRKDLFWEFAAPFWACSLLILAFALVFLKTYAIYPDRIEHRLLGVCYRTTARSDVAAVMRLYSGDRYGSMGFLISTKRAATRPEDVLPLKKKTPIDLCFKRRGFWREWLTGKHFFIQQFSRKSQEAGLLSVLTERYGGLAVDVRQDER